VSNLVPTTSGWEESIITGLNCQPFDCAQGDMGEFPGWLKKGNLPPPFEKGSLGGILL
jgi:hypothetical protein